MKTDDLDQQLKDLTPQQKLSQLQKILEKERSQKKRKHLFSLIERVQHEQLLLHEGVRKLESSKKEAKKEEPERLEALVEEEAQKTQKKESPLKLYGNNDEKPTEHLYQREQVKGPIYATEKQQEQYRQATHQKERTTSEEENLINSETHRLEKEKKKYETGR